MFNIIYFAFLWGLSGLCGWLIQIRNPDHIRTSFDTFMLPVCVAFGPLALCGVLYYRNHN